MQDPSYSTASKRNRFADRLEIARMVAISPKLRKPYTATKQRENWSTEEHQRFVEAIKLYRRDWKQIEKYVGTKTVIQIRSHAQKYFMKLQKMNNSEKIPPPRPKRPSPKNSPTVKPNHNKSEVIQVSPDIVASACPMNTMGTHQSFVGKEFRSSVRPNVPPMQLGSIKNEMLPNLASNPSHIRPHALNNNIIVISSPGPSSISPRGAPQIVKTEGKITTPFNPIVVSSIPESTISLPNLNAIPYINVNVSNLSNNNNQYENNNNTVISPRQYAYPPIPLVENSSNSIIGYSNIKLDFTSSNPKLFSNWLANHNEYNTAFGNKNIVQTPDRNNNNTPHSNVVDISSPMASDPTLCQSSVTTPIDQSRPHYSSSTPNEIDAEFESWMETCSSDTSNTNSSQASPINLNFMDDDFGSSLQSSPIETKLCVCSCNDNCSNSETKCFHLDDCNCNLNCRLKEIKNAPNIMNTEPTMIEPQRTFEDKSMDNIYCMDGDQLENFKSQPSTMSLSLSQDEKDPFKFCKQENNENISLDIFQNLSDFGD